MIYQDSGKSMKIQHTSVISEEFEWIQHKHTVTYIMISIPASGMMKIREHISGPT